MNALLEAKNQKRRELEILMVIANDKKKMHILVKLYIKRLMRNAI
jgi:hypothetical protein